MSTNRIGVIGAGLMGQGVAYRFAKYGCDVVLIDIDEDHLQEARKGIRNITRHDLLMNKAAQGAEAAGKIHYSTGYDELAGLPFLVENVTENLAVKERVYRQVRDIIDEDTIVAVNTSAVSITRIGAMLRNPAGVLGIHFMNPVHLKSTVEVIRGWHTSDATITAALQRLASIEMTGVVVKDYPGFISNRVLMLTINEAIFALQDDVATVADIDKIFRECFSHKMGPLETADLIGLDTILYTLEVLVESYQDPKFRPAPLLRKMVDAGLHGRKSGEGFYKY